MNEEIKQQLDRIERLAVLAAKKVLRIEDVAILTGLSKSTIYKMTCACEIPHYKHNGKTVFFNRDEVEEWLMNPTTRVATREEVAKKVTDYEVAHI